MHLAFPFATRKTLQVEVVLEEGGDVGQSRADVLLAIVEVHVTATRDKNLGGAGVGMLSEVLVGELPGIEANEKRGG